MQHCVYRVTYTAISKWTPATSVNFSASQYGAYATSSLLLYLHEKIGGNKTVLILLDFRKMFQGIFYVEEPEL